LLKAFRVGAVQRLSFISGEMALTALRSILLVSMALRMGSCMTSHEKGVIRREAHGDRQVQLDQSGHVEKIGDGERGDLQSQPTLDLHRSAEKVIPDTNKQYVKMTTASSDDCAGSPATQEITTDAECRTAALQLQLTPGDPIKINNYNAVDTGGVLLVVKKCYLNTTSNLVQFNPTEANSTDGQTLTGTKICWRPKYHMAAVDGGTDDLCTDDAQAITSVAACITAMTQAIDGDACRLEPFKEDEAINDPTKPIGCWRDGIGCWGFNSADTFTGGTNMTQVCKNVISS